MTKKEAKLLDKSKNIDRLFEEVNRLPFEITGQCEEKFDKKWFKAVHWLILEKLKVQSKLLRINPKKYEMECPLKTYELENLKVIKKSLENEIISLTILYWRATDVKNQTDLLTDKNGNLDVKYLKGYIVDMKNELPNRIDNMSNNPNQNNIDIVKITDFYTRNVESMLIRLKMVNHKIVVEEERANAKKRGI